MKHCDPNQTKNPSKTTHRTLEDSTRCQSDSARIFLVIRESTGIGNTNVVTGMLLGIKEAVRDTGEDLYVKPMIRIPPTNLCQNYLQCLVGVTTPKTKRRGRPVPHNVAAEGHFLERGKWSL